MWLSHLRLRTNGIEARPEGRGEAAYSPTGSAGGTREGERERRGTLRSEWCMKSMAESVELDKICGDQAWVRLQCLFYQCVACDDERRRIQLRSIVRRPIQIELFKSDALFGGRERSVVCVFVSCYKHAGEPRRRRRADGRPLQGRRGRAGGRARVRDRRRAGGRVALPAGAALRVVDR